MTHRSAGRFALALLCIAVLGGCVTVPVRQRDPHDPWQGMNRAMWKFDIGLVHKVAMPVDRTYKRVTPHFARVGLGNFFDNAEYPIVFVNDFLQAKLKTGLKDFGRFLMNSTVGIAGFLDPASRSGLAKNTNDFGRTLGTWGVPPGPYLVVPFLGPSDVRDLLGRAPDWYLSPDTYINDVWIYLGVDTVYLIDLNHRSVIPAYDLLESQHPFDPYAFARNAYLQRRLFLIHGQSVKSEEQQEEQLERSLEDSGGDPAAAAPSGSTSEK
jgi:phospholipid-binding lipoprotein MlaA